MRGVRGVRLSSHRYRLYRLTSDVSVCLHCVCENTAGTVKLDGVYTVPAA